jgi:hypothetical protein
MSELSKVRVLAILIIAFIGTAPATIASPVYRYIITPVPEASAPSGSPMIRRVALNKHHYSSHRISPVTRYPKSKLSTGYHYIWHVLVNTLYLGRHEGMLAVADRQCGDGRGV